MSRIFKDLLLESQEREIICCPSCYRKRHLSTGTCGQILIAFLVNCWTNINLTRFVKIDVITSRNNATAKHFDLRLWVTQIQNIYLDRYYCNLISSLSHNNIFKRTSLTSPNQIKKVSNHRDYGTLSSLRQKTLVKKEQKAFSHPPFFKSEPS